MVRGERNEITMFCIDQARNRSDRQRPRVEETGIRKGEEDDTAAHENKEVYDDNQRGWKNVRNIQAYPLQ